MRLFISKYLENYLFQGNLFHRLIKKQLMQNLSQQYFNRISELEFGIGIRNWNSEFEFEIGIQNWNSELEFGIGIRNWNSELE